MRRPLLVLLLALSANVAQAVQPVATQVDATQPGAATQARVEATEHDMMQAQFWGVSVQEIQKARLLMQPGSPRATFSPPTMSPLEILGIHATSDAERERYATLFVKAAVADTERVLAWTMASARVAKRLYPNAPIFDFGSLRIPKDKQIYMR